MAESSEPRKSAYPMITVDDAIAKVIAVTDILASTEIISLEDNPAQLLGRRIAKNIVAAEPVPAFPASIMDGYAVIASDGAGVRRIIANVTAGSAEQIRVQPGTVAYITTGAPLPPGADAIVPIEDTEAAPSDGNADKVLIKTGGTEGKWIREVGSDIAAGTVVLEAGTVIGSPDVGLLAMVGATSVGVAAQPVVGVLSTGDEVVSPSVQTLSGSMVRDSNRSMLLAAVQESGGQPKDLGMVTDDASDLETRVRNALSEVDVLVTSGGVSMGSLDLVKPLLERIGTMHFGRLLMKPGKPTTFATVVINGVKKYVFALPGNPVSGAVTFKLLVEPCVRRLSGCAEPECHPARVRARLAHDMKLDPARPEYHRVVLEWSNVDSETKNSVGGFLAHSTGMQRSSRLLSMRGASALVYVPQGNGVLKQGSVVNAFMLSRQGGAIILTPPTVLPHASGIVPKTRFTMSAEKKASAAAHSGCLCCLAKDDKSKENLPPPPTSGGQKMSGTAMLRCGVLTVSDRASKKEYEDKGGPEVLRVIGTAVKSEWSAVCKVVPDEASQIASAIADMVDNQGCALVITTGGTGPTSRDVTPEATASVLDKELPGFGIVARMCLHDTGEAMRTASLQYVSTAILSRQLAGIRKDSVVINFPGSPRSIGQTWPSVCDALMYCIQLIRGVSLAWNDKIPASESVPAPSSARPDPQRPVDVETTSTEAFATTSGASVEPELSSATVTSPQAPAVVPVEAPAAGTVQAPTTKETHTYVIDAVNLAWLDKIVEKVHGKLSYSTIVQAIISHTQTNADEAFVFDNVRGCGRKKVKQNINLALTAPCEEYLQSMAGAHNLPDVQKVLRVILDYAMEDAAVGMHLMSLA